MRWKESFASRRELHKAIEPEFSDPLEIGLAHALHASPGWKRRLLADAPLLHCDDADCYADLPARRQGLLQLVGVLGSHLEVACGRLLVERENRAICRCGSPVLRGLPAVILRLPADVVAGCSIDGTVVTVGTATQPVNTRPAGATMHFAAATVSTARSGVQCSAGRTIASGRK